MRKTQKGFTPVLILVFGVVIGVVALLLFQSSQTATPETTTPTATNQPSSSISSFEECEVAPGSTLTETLPAICITKDGKRFTDRSDQASEPESDMKTEVIKYSPQSDWETYTDNVAGFSVQYNNTPTGEYASFTKVGSSEPGESVRFDSCHTAPTGPFAGQERCTTSYALTIYDNYTGGSRRLWLKDQLNQIYKPYYMNYVIDGTNALLAIEGNPGGSSSMYVAIPKGNQVVLYSSSASWDPGTGELSDLTYHKKQLSTFKFTN